MGITLWDFTDLYSWIPSTFSGQGDACLWNSDFSTKPAYTSVIALLGGSVTSSASAAASTTASSTKTSSAAATTTASSGGGTIAKWGQCAGEGWTGSGTCVSGSTCTYSNPWYSQCL